MGGLQVDITASVGNERNAGPKAAVLFTCVGRRVALLRCFRTAAVKLGLRAAFYGTDTTRLSPALQECDRAFLVEPTTHAGYIHQLLSIVRDNRVNLLVPTMDLDLPVLSRHRPEFEALGCRVLISDPDVIDTCRDKRRTFEFLRNNGFDTPDTMSVRAVLAADRRGQWKWPCFLKQWDGSGSKGNAVARNPSELRFFARRIPNAICQELIEGTEYTCDAYVDFAMRVRCVVPRRRIEVRSGEVSKGQVVKNPEIMDQARRVVESLGAGPGVVAIQLFVTTAGEIRFTEINPRFGGGVPLSIEAGADFPEWILQELTGGRPRIRFDGFTDGLMMLRYDAEIWCRNADLKGAKVDVPSAHGRGETSPPGASVLLGPASLRDSGQAR